MESDAIVVGGGPAGSTVAHLLAIAGHRVALLEKQAFPRFHIGESLLPFAMPIFERLGVAEELKAKCQHKFGAFFSEDGKEGTRKVVFADGIERGHPLAFQVKRAEFDEMLLNAARQAGADVRIGWRVESLIKEGNRVRGVAARDADGERVDLFARIVVDATGRDAIASRAAGGIVPERQLRRTALYAHFENVPRGAEETEGDIRMVTFDTGWWWFIPFCDGSWSVGVVTSDAPLRATMEERFEEMVLRSTTVSGRLRSARRIGPVRVASDYSYAVKNLTGDGWIAVGDAAGFLDPIFSSGVFLALATAERAADTLNPLLLERRPIRARDLRSYEKFARRGFQKFRKFVLGFYNPAFREMFYSRPPVNALYASVTSILAGGVFSESLKLKFWTGLFLFFAKREMKKAPPMSPEGDSPS